MKELFVQKVVYMAADPTLKEVNTWASSEVQIAIGIVVFCICVFFLYKQEFGKMFGTVVFAAFIWVLANDPAKIFESIGSLFSKIFGG